MKSKNVIIILVFASLISLGVSYLFLQPKLERSIDVKIENIENSIDSIVASNQSLLLELSDSINVLNEQLLNETRLLHKATDAYSESIIFLLNENARNVMNIHEHGEDIFRLHNWYWESDESGRK